MWKKGQATVPRRTLIHIRYHHHQKSGAYWLEVVVLRGWVGAFEDFHPSAFAVVGVAVVGLVVVAVDVDVAAVAEVAEVVVVVAVVVGQSL